MEVNLLGTHQVVKAALDVGVERFVEFSTSEVYGPFIHKGKEDDLDDDRSDRREPLGLRGEQAGVRAPVVRALQGRRPAAGDRPAVQRLRPAAGRRRRDPRHDPAGAAARCRSRSTTTARRFARGASSTTSSTACCAAPSSPEAIGQAFNLGNPQGTVTNFELANMIIRLTNSKSEIVFKPHPGPGSRPARAVDREGDDAARLPADGVARSGHLAGDRLVRANTSMR